MLLLTDFTAALAAEAGTKKPPLENRKGTPETGIEYTTLFRNRKGRVTGIELNRDDLGAG
jgi:hypothetical protein